MDLGLNGKIALVTGASRGLGFATARVLAGEGVQLAINSRDLDQLSKSGEQLAQLGGEVIPLPGDVTVLETPGKLIAETAAAYGGLDLLFTNAGGPPPGAFEEIEEETWQHAIDLSFMSHVRLIRAALPWLRKSK